MTSTPPPQPRLRRRVLVIAACLGVGLIALVYNLPTLLGYAVPHLEWSMEAPAPETPVQLPDELTKAHTRYGQVDEKRPVEVTPTPPVAEYVGRTSAAPMQQGILPTWVPGAQTANQVQQDVSKAQQQTQGQAQPTQAPAPQPPQKKGWDWQARGKGTSTKAPDEATVKKQVAGLLKAGEGEDLIHHAKWAIPAKPLATLYRSQTLAGRLRQAVNSDIPGQVIIELTAPVVDKFGYEKEILPLKTLIVAAQEGKPTYGSKRLTLKLEQLELPTGEVITLKASVGDQDGANGMSGKVNNHLGKLLLATGLSAILNIGVRTATGTPSGYYQNPAQEAARDIGQDVQQTTKGIVEQQLRIPPTITIAAGTPCTLNLGENITFARAPVVVR